MDGQSLNPNRKTDRYAHNSRISKQDEYYGSGDWDDDMDPDTRRNAMNKMSNRRYSEEDY